MILQAARGALKAAAKAIADLLEPPHTPMHGALV